MVVCAAMVGAPALTGACSWLGVSWLRPPALVAGAVKVSWLHRWGDFHHLHVHGSDYFGPTLELTFIANVEIGFYARAQAPHDQLIEIAGELGF